LNIEIGFGLGLVGLFLGGIWLVLIRFFRFLFIFGTKVWPPLVYPATLSRCAQNARRANEMRLKKRTMDLKKSSLVIGLWAFAAGGCLGEGIDLDGLGDSQIVFGEIGEISGVVQNALNSDAVAGATVRAGQGSDSTDQTGYFVINQLAVGRELKMIELKKEVNELLGEFGRQEKYPNIADMVQTPNGEGPTK